MPRNLVLVSGSPGVGKTTLARPLATALAVPLIAKDDIKETLFDALNGVPGDDDFSRQIGGAAMEVMWTLAGRCPDVMLEANFRPDSAYERERILALGANVIEVHCRCDRELIAQRFRDRAVRGERHRAHTMSELPAEYIAQFEKPIGIGTVVVVETLEPLDVASIAKEIDRSFLREQSAIGR